MVYRFTHKQADRGAAVRPPTMRVTHWRCHAAEEEDSAGMILTKGGYFQKTGEGHYLHPQRLILGTNGQPTTLSLSYMLGARANVARFRPEYGELRVKNGDWIALRAVQAGPNGQSETEWFQGPIVQEHPTIQVHRDYEGYMLTAFGPEHLLRGRTVDGQWCKTTAADDLHIAGTLGTGDGVTVGAYSQVIQTHLPAIFNPKGQPNCANAKYNLMQDYPAFPDLPDARQGEDRVFDSPGRKAYTSLGALNCEATHWTAYTAVRSLISWFDQFELISPRSEWGAMYTLLGGTVISNVNVQGMNLLEALKAVLMPVGFGFYIEPWRDKAEEANTGDVRYRLVVYSLHNPQRRVFPKLSDIVGGNVDMDSASGQQAEAQRVDFLRDASHIANDVLVVGDVKRTSIVLTFAHSDLSPNLQPAWDTTTHDLSTWIDGDGSIIPAKNPDDSQATREQFFTRYNANGVSFPPYKHVFRMFVWNEDGAFNEVCGGTMPDLSAYGLGDGTNYARRPRPLAPPFLFDHATGKVRRYPVRIEAAVITGIDGTPAIDTTSWVTIPAVPLSDRAGFILTNKTLAGNLDTETWRPWAKVPTETLKAYKNLDYLTLLYNTLGTYGSYGIAFRMIGSIECDEAVTYNATRELDSAWPFKAKRVVYAPNRFKHRTVTTDPYSLGTTRHDVRNDAEDAAGYAISVRDISKNSLGHGSLILRFVTRAYLPGMGVPHTDGREVLFYSDSGTNERCPVITAVAWDFTEQVNKTEVVLDSPALQMAR